MNRRVCVAVALIVLAAIGATGCGSHNQSTQPAAKTSAANVLPWTSLNLQYAGILTKDCSASGGYQLQATCQMMAKSDIASLRSYAVDTLPQSRRRSDLLQAVDKWLIELDQFARNGCFTRETALECLSGPHLLNIELATIQAVTHRGVDEEQQHQG